jgi:peptide/nickel transport system substrate-binding protein
MAKGMRSRRAFRLSLGLLLGGLLLVGVAPAASTPRAGGTVIVGVFEPPNMNVVLRQSAVTLWAGGRILLGAYSIDPTGKYVPSLIAQEPRITTNPFSLTYTIKSGARWSDGVPVSARDFVFTWQVGSNPKVDIDPAQRDRYERIVDARILGPKTVKFVFGKPYEAWKELFQFVLPSHALQGLDMSAVWRDAIDDPRTGTPISDGPFVFDSWSRGDRLTLVRNERYWGQKAHLSRLVFRFLPDAASQLAALRSGQVDLVIPLPDQLLLSDLRGGPGLRVATGPTSVWDHIAFNFGPKANPLLRDPFVRKAIAYSIDRNTLIAEFDEKLLPGLKVLQSAVFLPFAPAYKPHWQIWQYRPRAAFALLRSHGCRKGPDGIFSCSGRRLSFRFTSTAGNQLRELTFLRVQAQLREVGIELQRDFEPPPLAFRRLEESGDWDLFLFGWNMFTNPTEADASIFGCHGKLNYYGYCNARVSKLLSQAVTELRFERRAALMNRADALMAKDVPFLPLFLKPGYAIYNKRIRNVVWNPSGDAFIFWNAQDWWISRS